MLHLIKQIIYRYSEHTGPEVKYSENNHLVAAIALAIDELIKYRRTKKLNPK